MFFLKKKGISNLTLFKPKLRRALLFSAALMAGVVAPAFVNAGSGNDVNSRINALEFQTQNISNSLDALNYGFGLTPPNNIGDQPTIMVAQSRDTAALNLRLSQVEEQVRLLTGQVEGLQFQMTQMQTLIERMKEDNEFRFTLLEGGEPGKTNAVTQSEGDRPVGELPQYQTPEILIPQTQDFLNVPFDSDSSNLPAVSPIPDTPLPNNPTQLAPVPLVFNGGERVIYQPPPSLLDSGQPLNLGFSSGQIVAQEDAAAQYKAGFDAIMQGDYLFAETQFRQFVELFPNHDLSADATNWFGEALLQRGQFDEAAKVLLDGFETHQNTPRGPDLLLKLGVALAGAGEKDTACRTFGEVLRRYSNMDGAFELRVAAEMARAQC